MSDNDGLKTPPKSIYASESNGKISIIIVTYNAASTLQNCLQSIYIQAYPDLEIVVIDGKSADGTIKILRKNTRIAFWKSEPDMGIYDAMNKALKYITGKWIYFLGADDELYTDFSKLAFELKNPEAIYYANVKTKGVTRSGKLSPYKHAKHGVFHQAIIYPQAVFKKYNYNECYPIYADYALNMKCWKDKSIKFIYKDYIIAHFNHTGSSGNVKDETFEKDKSRLILINFGLFIWLRYLVRNIKNRY